MVVMKASELCITSILLLHLCETTGHTAGVVISPPGVAPVCSGDMLELTCTVPGSFIEWSFFLIPEGEITAKRYRRFVHTTSVPSTSQLEVNSFTFTFSRTSAHNSLPLTSTLLVNTINDGLNGTMVNCTDVLTLNSTLTSILVINENDMIGEYQSLEITVLSEHFESSRDGIAVTLEWTEVNSLYSYHVSAVPQLTSVMSIGNTVVQFEVSYNIWYNVSVLAASPCGQNNMTAFIEVYYANCGNPADQVDSSILNILGYRDPAIEGSNITFSCLSGRVLSRPNTAICMGNGEWEPDIREIKCKTNCGPPSLHPNSYIIPYTNTLEGAEVTYVCWTVHQAQCQPTCKQLNVTAVCNAEGKWESNSHNICAESSGINDLNQNEKIVIASVTVFISTSILFFFVGFLCGHFRRKQSTITTVLQAVEKQDPLYDNIEPKQHEQELELKTNVAYGSATQQ